MSKFILFIVLFPYCLMAQVSLDEPLLRHIEETISPYTSDVTPGLSTAVVHHGSVVFMNPSGIANMESGKLADNHSIYNVDAMGRQFTTLAFLQMIEHSDVSMEDELQSLLPQFKKIKKPITLSHILNHTTGLDDYKIIWQVMGHNNYDRLDNEMALNVLATQERLSFDPGSDFSIFDSDTESLLMALIIEEVSDTTFEAFVDEYVFTPLGLDDAQFLRNHTEVSDQFSIGYTVEDGLYHKIAYANTVVGPGNLYISIHDLAKWYQYFSPNCTEKGHELVKQLDQVCRNSAGESYQSPWGEMTIGRSYFHYESGAPMYWQYGLRAGYGANVFRFPSKDVVAIGIGNNNQYNGYPTMTMVHPLVEDAFTRDRYISEKDMNLIEMKHMDKKKWEGSYHNFEYGISRVMRFENDTLRYIRGEQKTSLLPVGQKDFQALVDSDDILIFRFGTEAGRKFYEVTSGDSEPIRYEAIDGVFKCSKEDLQEYVGVYINESIGQIYEVSVQDGVLFISHYRQGKLPVRPIEKDVFSSSVYSLSGIEFRRIDGRVNSIQFKTAGLQSMIFRKVRAVDYKSL